MHPKGVILGPLLDAKTAPRGVQNRPLQGAYRGAADFESSALSRTGMQKVPSRSQQASFFWPPSGAPKGIDKSTSILYTFQRWGPFGGPF